MSVVTAAAVIGAGTQVYSASKAGKGTSTSKQELDPRFADYLYGNEDGTNKGLLSDAYDWYSQNKSGMNDQMRTGLNNQWAVLSDPNTMAGYQQMSNFGSGLMGTPLVGNPFSDGRAQLGAQGGAPASNLGLGSGSSPQFPSYQRPTTGAGPVMGALGPFTAPPAPPPAAAPVQAPTVAGPIDYFNRNVNPQDALTAANPGQYPGEWMWTGSQWAAPGYGGTGS